MLLLIGVIITVSAFAQKEKRVSPAETATGKIKEASITIHYSSPSVKDRKIWGGLVPYDSVWRAGANEATTFETDKDLKIQGQILPAGKYAFFLIPKENEEWVAIFNTVPTQWGAFKYDVSKDKLRLNVKPKTLKAKQEALAYYVTSKGISLNWDMISIPVNISVQK